MTLPPKRFEDPYDPRFDTIAGKPWYHRLIARREQIPMLHQAALKAKETTQKAAAEEYGVDERELRDYLGFIDSVNKRASPTFQRILDDAYQAYNQSKASSHIRFFIEQAAPRYGVNPRHVTEIWEISNSFYPSGYKPTV